MSEKYALLSVYNKKDILNTLLDIDVMISAVPYFHNLYLTPNLKKNRIFFNNIYCFNRIS